VSVIVDTPVWSAALRRPAGATSNEAAELELLVREGRAILLGPVRQELLSGIRSADSFKKLRTALRAFPEFRLRTGDYEEAAACFNRCRARGVQGSNTDFLLCGAALERGLSIYSTDTDFQRYAKVLRIRLHAPKAI
jgi:predicted nucleic acid-binding protein